MSEEKAYVSEIYASIQGEGPYTGERQIFLRLAGCPLRCRYCDTPASLVAQGHRLYTVSDVANRLISLRKQKKCSTISLTGGEPLVYSRFLTQLLPILKKKKFKIYLETAGIHSSAVQNLIKFVDVVAMDVKLPTSIGKSLWSEHGKFLKVVRKKSFVKIVLEKSFVFSEFKKAVELIRKTAPSVLLILQPASPVGSVDFSPYSDHIAQAYGYAATRLSRVLVMPQQQKIWEVR